MPEGGNNVNIDSIMLEINSNAKGATDSIDAVCGKLGELKAAIGGMTGKAQVLRNLANAMSVMSKSKVNLTPLISQLGDFSKLDLKGTGLSQFVGNLGKLNAATKGLDIKIFGDFAEEMKKMNDVSSSSTELLKAVNSLTRSSEKMKEAAANFPALSAQILEFFDSMSNVTVSDNTVMMAQGLADIARYGVNANAEMKRFSQSATKSQTAIKLLDITIESIRDGFKMLGKILISLTNGIKNFAGKAVEGVKSLASKIKEMTSQKGGIDTLHFSLKSLLTTLIGFRGITGIFSWTKEAVKAGGDLTEINHIVESMYGDMSDAVKAWADTMIDRYGIASMQAKQYAGTLMAMSKAAGVSAEKASEIGIKLTEAAGDISAFFNIDTADAYKKLQAGLAGQVRPLRSLGIDLQATTLKQYALDQGIQKSYTDMTQAEKIMLRYDYIMKVLSSDYEKGVGVLGDYERTSLSFANSMRKLQAYLSQIRTQIGAGLTAAIRPVIVALNTLMAKLLKAAKAFTVFMQTLFPFQNGSSGMALADSAEYADELADGTEGAADGLSDADDAAKKLKKDLSVLPFDELNQLAKDKELASTSTKTVGGTEALPSLDMGSMFDWDGFYDSLEDQKLPDAINEWAKKIKEAFEEHNWSKLGYTIADGINEGIGKLYEFLNPEKAKQKIDPFINAVTTTLNALIDGVNFELLGEALGNGLSIVTGAMNTFLEGFNWTNFGTQLANGANGLVNGIDWDGPNGVGTLFANKLKAIWETADGFVTHFGWAKLGTSLAKGATAFVNKVPYKTMAHAMATGINGIKTTVQNFVRGFPWTTLGKNLAAFSNDLVAWIDWSGITTTVGEGVNGIIDTFNSFFEDFEAEDFGTRLGTAITDFINTVKWKDIGTALSNVWNKAWEFLKGFITSLGGQDDHIEGIYNYQNIDQSLVHDIYKGQQGTGIGKAIHDVIESAIRGIKVDDMKEAINTLVSKVSQDVINVFGDQKMWYGLGQKIGETLAAIVGNPENAKKAASAINAIARGLDELLAGAIDALKKHWPNIKRSLYNFLTTLDWGAVLGLAAPFIGAALASKLATFTFSKIKTVLTSKIGGVFRAVGEAEGTKLAAGNIFKTIIDAIGPGGVEGGLIAAVVLATAEIQKFQELASGGNGVLTEEGGIIDSMISQMLEMGSTTKTTTDKLFDLKEEWEGGNISDEEFFSQATTILSEGGVSADEFKNAMIRLKDKVNTTNTQMGVLDKIMSGLPENTELAAEKLDEFGGKEEVIEKVRAALQKSGQAAAALGDESLPAVAQSVSTKFAEMVRSGSTFEEAFVGAFENITGEFNLSEQAIEAINTTLSETFGAENYNSIVSETGTAAEQLFGFFKYISGGVSGTNTELSTASTRTATLSGKISSMSGAVGAATTKTSGFADKLKTVNERTQTQAEKTDSVNTKLTNYNTNVDSASTKTSTLSGNTGTANTKLGLMATAAKTAAEKNASLASKADEAAKKIKTQGENADTAEGYVSNYNTTNEKTPSLFASVSKMLGGVLTTLLASYGTKSDFEGKLKEDVEGAETGIKDNSYLVEDAAKTMGQNTADAIDSYTMQEEFKSAGENDAKAVGTGMQNAQLDSASIASGMLSGMKGYLEGLTGEYGTAWWWGRNIADAIANGLKSVKLPIPKFSQTDWSEYKLDDNTSMWLPVFSSSWEIPWYAKGGLFTNPSIVGVGEAGRETVLPLENKRTMGMIADAIIDNSNGIGMDEETLASAVARGYVQAMMANQGNQQQPIYNIVVKTENDEVLARAVQRGNQALDYRNNPTPKLAY